MHLASFIFYGLSIALIGSAIAVVTMRNIFHAAIALVGALSLVAGFFALLGADFLASSQILVYVGGIMIIMLFVIMLSQQPLAALQRQTNEQWLGGGLLAMVIAAILVSSFRTAFGPYLQDSARMPTSASLGRLLLGEMVLPFEAVSLVLLAALVGAVLFGQEKSQ